MADRKITDLTALTTPASADVLPIVDVSEAAAADKNKKVTVGELFKGIPDGTAAAPAIAFESDDGNGLFLSTTDTIGISTNGVSRATVSTTAVTSTLPISATAFSPTSATVPTNGVYLPATNSVGIATNGSAAITIDSSQRLGVGTTSPSALLHVSGDDFVLIARNSKNLTINANYSAGNDKSQIQTDTGMSLAFATNGDNERGRFDSSGRFLVGTSSTFDQSARLQVIADTGTSVAANFYAFGADNSQFVIGAARGTVSSPTTLNSTDTIGGVYFRGHDGTSFKTGAQILAQIDGITPSSDLPSRLVFSVTSDGSASPTEALRISQDRAVSIGGISGSMVSSGGYLYVQRQSDTVGFFNRNTNDGTIIDFRQDNVSEGSISVSGTTVSYNGAHLSRWTQLPGGAERTEILRGTVLSNIDEMCEWGDEENEQLNRMKVSDVEGDKNVSGVFQAWDDDDDTYTNDFYCAMTGDFIIRIGAGVTVERGDLLMSAGDGTAKPQDDDIIRSKTIAKVTSTNVSCTYPDGSYCVPCVLMAC